MVSNGDRFEAAYNKIDALLRENLGITRTIAFSLIVLEAAKKDPTVRAYKDDLLEYGDLRNSPKTVVVISALMTPSIGRAKFLPLTSAKESSACS
jgi:hypothetical protein